MSESPAKKRRRKLQIHYHADGTQLLRMQTLRRRQRNVQEARRTKWLSDIDDVDAKNEEPENTFQSKPSGSVTKLSASYVEEHEEQEGLPTLRDSGELHDTCEMKGPDVSSSSTDPHVVVVGSNDEGSDYDSTRSTESLNDDDVGSEINDAPVHESLSPIVHGPSSSVTDSDRGGFNADELINHIFSGGDDVMFQESNLKKSNVILIILGLCTRFSLSNKARRALVEATKLFAGPRFSSWDISDYYLSKVFDPPDDKILYHFFCQRCCIELEKPVTKSQLQVHEAVCDACSEKYTLSTNSPNYFISLDLKYQIISVLNSSHGNQSILKNLRDSRTDVGSSGVIRDVYDGLLYKKLLSETPKESRLITYVFNTDGAPLFNSSKRAFWPIIIILNELPPGIRFQYPLLAGLLIVRKEPSPDLMNTYMESFVRQANTLSTKGFHIRVSDKIVHFLVKPLACTVDSVARPLLQNRIQFNGYYGCSWCYCRGVHVHGCTRFLMTEDEPSDRTHDEYTEDMKAAVKKNISGKNGKKIKVNVRGVKGGAILSELITFDMVWGFFRDYLHADLIGVAYQLWTMWCDQQGPIHIAKAQQEVVNERLMKMTPPHEVHRLVRPLNTEKCKWKASEWRSWLLFYAIPCLIGILDDYALQHFFLYVNSIHTLLKTEITERDLEKAEYDLQQFVIIFEALYGEKYVTFNVHSVKHLINCVRYCGPLWAMSTFPVESTIHTLKQFVHGPRGVYQQMSKKTMQMNIIRGLLSQLEENAACIPFYRSLFGRYEVASFRRIGAVVLVGKGRLYNPGREIRRLISIEGDIIAHQRCIFSQILITSVTYTRAQKSNDTTFIVKGGRVVKILNLLHCGAAAFAEVACFGATRVTLSALQDEDCGNYCPVIDDVSGNSLYLLNTNLYDTIIPVEDILEKCVVMNVDEQTYISRLPNTVEIQ